MQQNQTIQTVQTVQTNNQTAGQNATATSHNKPEKKFQAGTVSITVWKNSTLKDGKQVEYRTISLGRSYKKNGAWQNSTASMRVNDLPKLSAMIDEAYKYLILNTKQEQEGGEEAIVM